MNDQQGFPVKKAFLYALIGSVVLSALLGIGAILSGRFGWFEIRILLTTITISVASICGLACGDLPGHETRSGSSSGWRGTHVVGSRHDYRRHVD